MTEPDTTHHDQEVDMTSESDTDSITDSITDSNDTDVDADPLELHRNAIAGRPFTPPPGQPSAADAGIGNTVDEAPTPLELHRQATDPAGRLYRTGIDGYPTRIN